MSVGYFNSKMCPDAHNCNMTIADDFCYKNYGGQLASPTDDSQYTTLRDQVNGDGGGASSPLPPRHAPAVDSESAQSQPRTHDCLCMQTFASHLV